MIDDLAEVSAVLDGVLARAESVGRALSALGGETASALEDAVASAERSLESAKGKSAAVAAAISADSVLISKSVGSVVTEVDGMADGVERGRQKLKTALDRLRQDAIRLDEVKASADGFSVGWQYMVADSMTSLQKLVDAVKVGALDVGKMIEMYGNAFVEGQRLSDFLAGLPLGAIRKDLKEFIQDVRHGSTDLQDVIAFLGESQLEFAKRLSSALEQYKSGKVTLEYLAKLIAQIKASFPGTQAADLTQAILDGLRRGDLD